MQISSIHIYLWQIADTAQFMVSFLVIAGIILSVVLIIIKIALSNEPEEQARFTKYAPLTWKLTSFIFLVRLFIPSSEAIAVMVVVPKLVNSEVVQKDIPELYSIAIEALKSKLTK